MSTSKTSRRLLLSAVVLSAMTLTSPIVVSAADGFSVATPASTIDVANGFLTFDKQTSADQKWLVPSGNWYFSVNTADINAGLKNPEVHATYVSATGAKTQLTFNGDGTQTLRGDRSVNYQVQVKNGEVILYNGGSNASMDIPVRTTQTTYFKDTNGHDIWPSVVQNNAIIGQHYTTSAQSIPGYTLIGTPINASGTVSNQKTTYVVGTTTKEPLYDDDGNQWAISTKTITDAAGSVTETLQVTDETGRPISPVLSPSENGPIAPGAYGTFANLSRYYAPYGTLYLTNHNIEPDTVTYTYKKKQESAKIVFRTPTGSPIGSDQTITGNYGDTPSYTPPTIPGYEKPVTPDFKPFDDNGTPTYTVVYKPLTENVTVKAKLIDQNGNLTDLNILDSPATDEHDAITNGETNGSYNSTFKIGVPTLSNDDNAKYEYAGADANTDADGAYYNPQKQLVTGTYKAEDSVVTFYFREKPQPATPASKQPTKNPDLTPTTQTSTVTVDYVPNGKTLITPPAQSQTGEPGGDTTFEVPEKDGYTPYIDGKVTTTGTHTVKFPDGGKVTNIIVNYVPDEQTITVHHVDEKGHQIAPDVKMTGLTGDAMTAEAYTQIKGYTVKGADTQTGTFGTDKDLTFVYTKKTMTVTIHPYTRDKNGNRVEIPGQTHDVEVPWTDNQTDVPVSDLPDIPYYTRNNEGVDGGYVTTDGKNIHVDMTVNPPALWVEYTPDTKMPIVGKDVGKKTDTTGKIVPVDPDGNPLKTTTDNTYTGKPGTELPTPTIPGYIAKVTKVTVPDGGGDITVVYTKVPDTPVVPASTEPATSLAPKQAAPIITTNKSDDTPVLAPENDGKNHADLMLPKTGVSARSSLSVIGLLVAGLLAMFAMLFRPTRRRKTNK